MNKKTQMPNLNYISPNRYVCDVLEEMRKCIKFLNFRPMPSLIEEVQMMANRMEAALGTKKDIQKLHEDLHNLKKARTALKKEVQDLIDGRD